MALSSAPISASPDCPSKFSTASEAALTVCVAESSAATSTCAVSPSICSVAFSTAERTGVALSSAPISISAATPDLRWNRCAALSALSNALSIAVRFLVTLDVPEPVLSTTLTGISILIVSAKHLTSFHFS